MKDEEARELKAKMTMVDIENDTLKQELSNMKEKLLETEEERDDFNGQVNLLMNQIKLLKNESEKSRSASPIKRI